MVTAFLRCHARFPRALAWHGLLQGRPLPAAEQCRGNALGAGYVRSPRSRCNLANT